MDQRTAAAAQVAVSAIEMERDGREWLAHHYYAGSSADDHGCGCLPLSCDDEGWSVLERTD